jgi:superfamily II DNA or RNA helicase
MKLVIDRECSLFGAGPEVVNKIKQSLTMENPAYAEARKHKRWTGKIDRKLIFYDTDLKDCIKFPRGAIRQALEITGRNIDFQDNRQILPEIDFKFFGKLRPYQDEALQAILGKDFGILEALTGSGKTVIALAVIANRKQPTLILCHTKELLVQWVDRINSFLHVEAGLIGDGRFDVRPITVGIINSVRKHLNELPEQFGQIIVDEVHRTPSTMLSEIVRAFDCKFALGCSATPYRRDQLTRLIHWFIGPLVHKIDPKELEDTGAVLIPDIRTRETGFNYQKLLSLIVVDEDRNNMIVRDILFEIRHHPGTVLVVSDRIEHCEILLNQLKLASGIGYDIKMLTGQLKPKERTSLVEDLRAGRIDVVVATIQLVGEGLDVPEFSSLFLTTPIKFEGRLIQVIGRILRPADGKKPRVYDYQDPVGPLFASAKAREKTYMEMNWLK